MYWELAESYSEYSDIWCEPLSTPGQSEGWEVSRYRNLRRGKHQHGLHGIVWSTLQMYFTMAYWTIDIKLQSKPRPDDWVSEFTSMDWSERWNKVSRCLCVVDTERPGTCTVHSPSYGRRHTQTEVNNQSFTSEYWCEAPQQKYNGNNYSCKTTHIIFLNPQCSQSGHD